MNHKARILLGACLITLAMTASVWAQTAPAKTSSTFYTQTNLVSSMKSLRAKLHDKNLINPWGLVQGPTPFWVSDNNAGVSTLYDGTGKICEDARQQKERTFCGDDPAADEQYQHCGAIRNRLQQCVHGFYWRSFHLFSRRRNDFGLATGRRV